MLFCCRSCDDPCELRVLDTNHTPPPYCPFERGGDPRWLAVPSGRSTMPRTGLELLPGPFCEVPATAIVRAVAEAGRYSIEVGLLERLVFPVSRAAFNDAVTAMEAVSRDAVE